MEEEEEEYVIGIFFKTIWEWKLVENWIWINLSVLYLINGIVYCFLCVSFFFIYNERMFLIIIVDLMDYYC